MQYGEINLVSNHGFNAVFYASNLKFSEELAHFFREMHMMIFEIEGVA